VILLYRDRADGAAERVLEAICAAPPLIDVVDDDDVRHRVWRVATEGAAGRELIEVAGAAPLTIADGHHRYETALRYGREHEEGASGGAGSIMVLLLAAGHGLTVLATHRVVRGGPGGDELLRECRSLFEVEPVASASALAAAFRPGTATPRGRFGLWTGSQAAILRVRRDAFVPLVDPEASETLRWLDVSVLAIALERLAGLSRDDTAAGGRLVYTKEASEAIALVDRGEGTAAFLLDPTPPEDVIRVAAAGEVMPQKSTYFYPKPVSGLLFNPFDL
jgi:uncharacterized protein (DUF1015 family)